MDGEELVIVRSFNAPRELVWKATTQIEHLKHWWGPKGVTWLRGSLDFRPGGVFHYGFRALNGQEIWGRFVYRDIVEHESISYVMSFSDPEGSVTRGPFFDVWPLEVLITLAFEEDDGVTTLTLTTEPINATAEERAMFKAQHPSMRGGYGGTYDKLEDYLASIAQSA